MFRLDGKIALVTGASSGIGVAIAQALHGQGAHVVLSGRREAELAALAGQLGERARVAVADLAVYACMRVCAYTSTCVCVYVYVCLCVCVCVSVYVHICIICACCV